MNDLDSCENCGEPTYDVGRTLCPECADEAARDYRDSMAFDRAGDR